MKWLLTLLVFCLCVTACNFAAPQTGQTPTITPKIETASTLTPATTHIVQTSTAIQKIQTVTAVEPTSALGAGTPTFMLVPTQTPVNLFPTTTSTPRPSHFCPIGTGLREETIDLLLANKNHPGLIMSASAGLAEQYFPQFEGWIRVMGAPSLATLQDKGMRANSSGVPYEALGYGLETSKSTPDEEWQDLIGSTQKARQLADELHTQLLMAPGFKLMSDNEGLYPSMAAMADIWMLQTQQLQKGPPGPEYRQEVERIVNLIRSGNPGIAIWAQITLPPDREPNAAEWLEYRQAIMDLVDGTYIGVYTWDASNQDTLVNTIKSIIAAVCPDG